MHLNRLRFWEEMDILFEINQLCFRKDKKVDLAGKEHALALTTSPRHEDALFRMGIRRGKIKLKWTKIAHATNDEVLSTRRWHTITEGLILLEEGGLCSRHTAG